MFAINIIMSANPFYDAYYNSDLVGKLIFLSIIFTSIVSWIILCQKFWHSSVARSNSNNFYQYFQKNKNNPLTLEWHGKGRNPFWELYVVLKRQAQDILNKNQKFSIKEGQKAYLSSADIETMEAHLMSTVSGKTMELEKNLFILSTIVGLAPLLGLLGTVWGILVTFSDMQANPLSGSSHAMLHGLSLALTTTVLGLVAAIPALIAYNWLRAKIRLFETEMEGFSTEMLSSVELQWRKVELS